MRKGPHPIRFFILVLPFGAAFGYAAVALQWAATKREGVAVSDFGKVISAAFVVHGIKFLWAPIVDATLAKRTWYVISLALSLVGLFVSGLMPLSTKTLPALTAVIMASQIGLTLLGMACENLLGNLPAAEKGRGAGFYQAGNFVGLGLGGGLALDLTERFSQRWMGAAILCAILAPCALALIGLPEPPRSAHGLWPTVKTLGRDLLELVVKRVDGRWLLSAAGLSGLFIALSPTGSGAAGNYWPSIASHWGASTATIELVNGWLGGVIGGAGALAGGWLSDRMQRRNAYVLGGAATAISGLLFAIAPLVPGSFVAGVLVYTFFNGVAFGAFSAFVLETIGHGAVATKYNIFASLANLATSYMINVDGKAFDAYKESGMLFVDAACTFGGVGVMFTLVAAVQWFARRQLRGAAPAAS
ncbi:MAG TPA: MFS transporter [Byssovorax sp.]|jgi:MFS family permease